MRSLSSTAKRGSGSRSAPQPTKSSFSGQDAQPLGSAPLNTPSCWWRRTQPKRRTFEESGSALRRLRSELRQVARRDYFPPPERDQVEVALALPAISTVRKPTLGPL